MLRICVSDHTNMRPTVLDAKKIWSEEGQALSDGAVRKGAVCIQLGQAVDANLDIQ